ncbi:MAG: hypothetical protein M3016_01055 [Actinomycetota bacterium]|nr:hypothetical protein [Actinomycetota bacterium]
MRLPRSILIALVILGALELSPTASASSPGVTPGASQIVVVAPGGARAVVTRSPFSLSVLDASGTPVLRSVTPASGVSLPTPIPPQPQAEFGTIGSPPPAVYAPLTFLAGSQQITQTPAGQWEGTLGSVTESGVEYSARAVIGVRRQANAAVLTISTNDPTGRKLVMTIAPRPRDTLRIGVTPTPSAGVATVSSAFTSSSTEAFRGFGGRHNSLDQHGSEFYNWIDQENVSSGSASGVTATASPGQDRYLFPNGPEAAYYAQSSFISSHGYGFLLNRDEISHWRLDSDRPDAWQVEAGAPALDYVVVAARAAGAISQLTNITGRQRVPPAWATGSILDRLVKYPSDPASSYQQEVSSDLRNIDRYHLHLDAYRIEGWPELPRPVLAQDIAALKARGIHPMLYFRAFVGTDKTGTDDPGAYDYALAHGYVATHANGSPYTFVSNFNGPAAVIDFTNPAAVRWWQRRIRAALDLGADGFMQDFGEQVLTDMHFRDGSTGLQMHNRLPVLYDRATREAIDAYQRDHPGRHIFFFTRAGYSGTPGNAAYENANFPGDETTDWTRASGLASQTPDMLNRAIGGAFGFSSDIGGYLDLGPYQPTTKELFLRWAEWAALSPLFRLHGSVGAGTHTPWSYDAQTVRIYRGLTALHLRARPLILRLWRQAVRTGIPITRPLWLAYPGDPRAGQQDQEWLLGPHVLVAPVVTQGASSRQLYLPRGCWVRPDVGSRYAGPASVTVSASLGQLPYFFACGTQPFGRAAARRCPAATGRLTALTLGRLHLGQRRRAVRRTFARVRTRHLRYMDFFCLAGNGVRVGYASPKLLRALTVGQRRRTRARAVLLLTANRHYALRGVRPGNRWHVARRRLHGARRYKVGKNTWYLLPGARSSDVLKVRRGRVQEVGIANRRLTRTRRVAGRFLRSF